MQLKTGDKIDMSCTWGDGPDVWVNIYRDSVKVKGWKDGIFPMNFTSEEAIQIGHMLIQRGKHAQELKQIAIDHDNWIESGGKE